MALAKTKVLEGEKMSKLMMTAVDRGVSLEYVMSLVQEPSKFNLSTPFPDGQAFTPRQAITALLLSYGDDGLRESPADALRSELNALPSIPELRNRAVVSKGDMAHICAAFGSDTERADLISIILKAELVPRWSCSHRRCCCCSVRLPYRERLGESKHPKTWADLSAIDDAQWQERRKGYEKTVGEVGVSEYYLLYTILSSWTGTVRK
jgi:hypothetical protein